MPHWGTANKNLDSTKTELDQLKARHDIELADASHKLEQSLQNNNQLVSELKAIKNELQKGNKKILIDTLISAN